MLLVSSLTPSGRSWVLDSAARTVGHERVVDLGSFADPNDDVFDDITSAVSITGAQFTSADLIAGLRSFRDVAALVRVWELHGTDEPRAVVWCSGSVPQVLADLEVLGELADVAGTSLPSATLRARLTPVLGAVRSGDIEWLFATPAQPDAVQQASLDVAAAVGIGATVRGVLVAPMPRQKDGWPKEIRVQAREIYGRAVMDLHPITTLRTRSGEAPAFPAASMDAAQASTIVDAGGDRIFTLTLPGLSAMEYGPVNGGDIQQVHVGTWSADPAYPTTHVVVRFAEHTVRWEVDATLRRCRAIDAVVADDTIAVTFVPVQEQWPSGREPEEGGA